MLPGLSSRIIRATDRPAVRYKDTIKMAKTEYCQYDFNLVNFNGQYDMPKYIKMILMTVICVNPC